MITNSIRFKTTILYSGILGFILLSFSVFLYHSVGRILYKNIEAELAEKAEHIAGTINAYGEISRGKMPPTSLMRQFLSDDAEEVSLGKGVIDRLWEKHRWLLGANNEFFRVLDMKGGVVLQSENLPTGAGLILDKHLSPREGAERLADVTISGEPFRGISYPFTFNYRQSCILQLVVPLSSVRRTLSQLLIVMGSGSAFILLLSLFIGSFLTRRILHPVMEVTRTASQISQRNLGVRITEEEMDQEMQLLVESFNQMIGRLEKSFAHINEFSSHVAHELKTPLAIVKGELELALCSEGVSDEDRRVMEVALQEIDRLIKIIKDLLLLARFDYRLDIFQMTRLDLTAFLVDVCQHAQVLASGKEIQLKLALPEGPRMVTGDATHLRRLFFNLIHNAVKFTPSGGRINVTVKTGDAAVLVSVRDTGCGIAPADQPRIFEQFYRGNRRDGETPPGTGLGLCLARSIARAHGGDIFFESDIGKGTTFTVRLPLATTDDKPSVTTARA